MKKILVILAPFIVALIAGYALFLFPASMYPTPKTKDNISRIENGGYNLEWSQMEKLLKSTSKDKYEARRVDSPTTIKKQQHYYSSGILRSTTVEATSKEKGGKIASVKVYSPLGKSTSTTNLVFDSKILNRYKYQVVTVSNILHSDKNSKEVFAFLDKHLKKNMTMGKEDIGDFTISLGIHKNRGYSLEVTFTPK